MSKLIELTDDQVAALARAASPRAETAEQFLAELVGRMTDLAWLPVFDAHGSLEEWTRLGQSLSVLRARARARGQSLADLVDSLAADTPTPPPVYDSVDEFARHLGATEEEIQESKRLTHERFPPVGDGDRSASGAETRGAPEPNVAANADA